MLYKNLSVPSHANRINSLNANSKNFENKNLIKLCATLPKTAQSAKVLLKAVLMLLIHQAQQYSAQMKMIHHNTAVMLERKEKSKLMRNHHLVWGLGLVWELVWL